MKQSVTVISCSGRKALVGYRRPTACHQDCQHCSGGCGATAASEYITVTAENEINAKPGDHVIIDGAAKKVVEAIALVYIIPLLLFFVGYFLGDFFGVNGAIPAIVLFCFGLLIAILVSRGQQSRGKEISFRIVSFDQN